MFFQELSVCEALARIAHHGFQAAEVWMDHLIRTGESPPTVSRCGRELGLELSLHAAAYDINITSTTTGIREESLRQIHQSILTAAQMEAKIVVVHPGRLSASRGCVETCRELMNAALAKINEWALAAGTAVGLESMEKRPKEVFVTPADMQRLLRPEWSSVGFTLDLAHAGTFMDPADYVAQFDSARILHAHFSDSGDHAVHARLGTGRMDVHAALSALSRKFSGLAIVEGYVPGRGEETVGGNAAWLKKFGWL